MRPTASVTAVLLFLVLSLAAVGVGYGLWSNALAVHATAQTDDFNAKFTAASTNDPPDTIDPGKDKNVGFCTAKVIRDCHWAEPREVKVVVSNAYPGYECEVDVTIAKGGCLPECIKYVVIDTPPELSVRELSHLAGTILDHKRQEVEGRFLVGVNQSAHEDTTYEFTVSIRAGLWQWCQRR